ncbi:hypothetical protein [Rheinheimera aquimaris]|uniref:hypothetical protein n=1 Tax=Rheinheimera aquimaris TaxID=412437 RepID=UPI003A97C794
MAAINAEQKAVLDIAHSYYRQTNGTCYSFYLDQLTFNGIKHPQVAVDSLLDQGLLQKLGPRYRISETGINAVEAAAISLLETK